MVKNWRCVLVLVISCIVRISAQYSIEGKIRMSEEWDTVIYLSAINSFDHFSTASLDFLINSSHINEDGAFQIQGDNLPIGDRIYRLHVVKKDDPVNTIIIGGKEENHVHFVMNNTSRLRFIEGYGSNKMTGAKMTGHYANQSWYELQDSILFKYRKSRLESTTQKNYNTQKLIREMQVLADTCNFPIISLLALDKALQEQNKHQKKEIEFYDQMAKRFLEVFPSPYSNEFSDEVNFIKFTELEQYNKSSINSKALYFASIVIIGALIIYLIVIRTRHHFNNPLKISEKIHDLSVREKMVFELLVSGKTNKEISSDLNIGLTTVKSHVSSIYSKLGVKSRKEIAKIHVKV